MQKMYLFHVCFYLKFPSLVLNSQQGMHHFPKKVHRVPDNQGTHTSVLHLACWVKISADGILKYFSYLYPCFEKGDRGGSDGL